LCPHRGQYTCQAIVCRGPGRLEVYSTVQLVTGLLHIFVRSSRMTAKIRRHAFDLLMKARFIQPEAKQYVLAPLTRLQRSDPEPGNLL
jgi:hypothetical protein